MLHYFIFKHVIQGEMSVFSIFSSGGQFVRGCRTFCPNFRLSALWGALMWNYIKFGSLVQTEMLRLKYKVYARRTMDKTLSQ